MQCDDQQLRQYKLETYLLERCMTTCGRAAGMRAERRSRARNEAPARDYKKKVRGSKKHLEYTSWVENEVIDLFDLKNTRIFLTGRWVLTIKTDNQGHFLKEKASWLLRGSQNKQKEYQQTDSPASTRPGFRMSCKLEHFSHGS